jgi:hypothetical protein
MARLSFFQLQDCAAKSLGKIVRQIAPNARAVSLQPVAR